MRTVKDGLPPPSEKLKIGWESLGACGEEARGRAGQYPARPCEDESAELLGRDDLEEFDLEH
jgi:hypothetical protein